MKYILQDKNRNLGNFINCTPTLKALADHYGEPSPVYFETDYVKQCFLDCGFIRILDSPQGEVLFQSGLVNKKIPDWQYIFEEITPLTIGEVKKIPWTYVDRPSKIIEGKFYVIIRGSGNDINPNYSSNKDPGQEIYDYILNKIPLKSVFVGSVEDYKYRKVNASEIYVGNIRDALGIINGAEFVISNDSGLYHAAGAMKKKGFIMWKDTLFEKNRSPNDFTYSFNWKEDFDEWITALKE